MQFQHKNLPKLNPLHINHNSIVWRLSQIGVCTIVGRLSQLFLRINTNSKTVFDGIKTLNYVLENKSIATPLITIANHISTIDDPVLWGLINSKYYATSINQLRYTLGAQEICYTNPILSWFFTSGKTIPIVRGDGVYQPGMNGVVQKLNLGSWVHIFPEAKVNQSGGMLPFKWGVGRLIMDSLKAPIVIPIYHTGLDKIHPMDKNWLPNPFTGTICVYVGNPIDTTPWRARGEQLIALPTVNLGKSINTPTAPPPHVICSTQTHRQWITSQLEKSVLDLMRNHSLS